MENGSKNERIEKRKISLKMLISVGMISIILLLLILFVSLTASIWRSLSMHERSGYSEMLELQIEITEREFERVQTDLLLLAVSDVSFAVMQAGGADYDFHKLQLHNKFAEYLRSYSYVNGMFILDISHDQVIIQHDADIPYTQVDFIKEYLGEVMELGEHDELAAEKYRIICQDENGYVLIVIRSGTMILGGWCDLQQVFAFAGSSEYPFTGYGFTQAGESNAFIPDADKSIEITSRGAVSGTDYHIYVSRSRINQTVFQMMQVDIAISVLIILILAGIFYYIVRSVLAPMRYMEGELRRIGAGELGRRLDNPRHLMEYQVLYENFNQMLEQVGRLKIQIYEEQMEKQKVEMAFLTMQTNPHFYVNSLNVIHSLAEIKNYQLIEEMTRCLSGYYNYIFRKNSKRATIAEEISHIRNYLQIQKIRYAETLDVVMEIDEESRDARIPVLLLHTFVENALKYSAVEYEVLLITLRITMIPRQGRLRVVITDNGNGFSSDILVKLEQDNKIEKADGEHIGITNLRRRAELFFSGRFQIRFCNQTEGGARIEMEFPYLPETDIAGEESGDINC